MLHAHRSRMLSVAAVSLFVLGCIDEPSAPSPASLAANASVIADQEIGTEIPDRYILLFSKDAKDRKDAKK